MGIEQKTDKAEKKDMGIEQKTNKAEKKDMGIEQENDKAEKKDMGIEQETDKAEKKDMGIEQETDKAEKKDMGIEQENDKAEKKDMGIEQEDISNIREDGDVVDQEGQSKNRDNVGQKRQLKNRDTVSQERQLKNRDNVGQERQLKSRDTVSQERQSKGRDDIDRKSQLNVRNAVGQMSQPKNDEHVKDSGKEKGDTVDKQSVNKNIRKKVQAGRDSRSGEKKAQVWDRDAERARRREMRRRQVMIYKICILAVIILIVCVVAGAFVWNITSLKLSRKMAAGDKYTAGGDYEMAQKSYEEALEIDSGTVEAYRCLAQNYDAQSDGAAAKEILYLGWENTQDESLLRYYCTIILNEAVAQINEKECSLETVDKCIQVLRLAPDNEDALSLLDTCYERLYTGSDEDNKFDGFMSGGIADNNAANDNAGYSSVDNNDSSTDNNDSSANDKTTGNSQYEDYEQELRTMLELYKDTKSKEIGNLLTKYAVIDTEYVYLDVNYLTDYNKLLNDINAAAPDKSIEELADCLADAIKMQEDFSGIFTEFSQGNYESAKEFIVSDTYVKLRDSFINGENGYWEGASAIPINQEKMAVHKTKEGFKFFWLKFDDYDNPQGVITVWGSRQLDDGVQRTTISYEPAGKNGEYYPHMEYVISYEYSNVLENGTDVKMNYRFNTITTTEEGTETEAVGDWGGENEWRTSY